MGPESETVRLLRRISDGDPAAAEDLLELVYGELHTIAARLMNDERGGHTLQTTALIHEAWLKLAGGRQDFEDRRHFLRVAATAMRRALVDHARARKSAKRGGGRAPQPLDEAVAAYEQRSIDLVALDEALERLGTHDTELARVVELRYFGGLTLEEVAAVQGVAVSRIHRTWIFARGWLRREMGLAG